MPEADLVDELARGRDLYATWAWAEAYESLASADRATPLGGEDLERLATSAYMIGRDDDQLRALERAHQRYLDAGQTLRAVRCGVWLTWHFQLLSEMARGAGWLGRARRLLERDGRDCVERGYVLAGAVLEHNARRDWEAVAAVGGEAVEIAARFGDADLLAIGLMSKGPALIKLARVGEGLRLCDEAMVAATAGELSPIATGLVYCGVIDGCQGVYEVRRAREWTAALAEWCDKQPDPVPFTGPCLLHRAEILELHGAWAEALEEARRGGRRFEKRMNPKGIGQATYRQGELHRLRGEFAEAEDAYRAAGRAGWEPQPGLALLRLAQRQRAVAIAAIRRALGEASDRLQRAKLLPACVEITLAVGDTQAARNASRELEEISATYSSVWLGAMADHARGAVDLAEGEPRAALVALRRACQVWHDVQAPYECARARVLVGLACSALGDDEAATLEVEAARGVFAELGATTDLERVATLAGRSGTHGLTERELQVLRLVAAGKANKAIAAELVLSERTVDRHLSNIFAKLGLSSRAAATAYAYEHRLV